MQKLKNKIIDFILAITPFIVLLILWLVFYKYKIIPNWLLVHPKDVLVTIQQLIKNGTIVSLIINSLVNASIAFIIALVLALVFGTIIGLNKTCKKIFLPTISFLYPIPSLGWLPLIVMIFGFSRTSVWIIVGISAFFKMVFGVINGIRGIDRNIIWSAKNMGFKNLSLITQIIYPAAFPQIMTSIRLGFGSAWRSLIGAEIIMPIAGGLGTYISRSQFQFRFDQVITGLLIIALISYFIEKIIFEKIENNTLIKYGIIRH